MDEEEISVPQNSSASGSALHRRIAAVNRHLNPLGPSLFHSSFREENGFCFDQGKLSANPTNGAEKEMVGADTETPKPARDKVILVIGAGTGTGGAVAKRFAKGGYVACIVRRHKEALKSLEDEIIGEGGQAHSFGVDARKEEEVVKLVEHIESSIGDIEVLVFNIGANEKRWILETTARLYYKVWEMAAFSGFLAGREVARKMVERKRGTIIFTGATASVRGGSGFAAFAGAKFALRALAQSMARELGPKGIHVIHAVVDAPINTVWTRGMTKDPEAMISGERAIEPEDVGELYWHLHQQPRRAWTHEIDLRPWKEPW
ncbi:hypothetical protein R1flu_017592 [Riccia fluitans]|uniref:Short-chain dehydrogenase/reductase SDR n=1 Tax=Riccia fluitans TaxID=41844 RepID=A0ABD1ZGT1_9MARC